MYTFFLKKAEKYEFIGTDIYFYRSFHKIIHHEFQEQVRGITDSKYLRGEGSKLLLKLSSNSEIKTELLLEINSIYIPEILYI